MLQIIISNQFKRDLKLAQKRGYDLKMLNDVIDKLALRQPLPDIYRDHKLNGKYDGFRECHIQPDWLLVYRVDEKEIFLFLLRTGTHSDLFC